MTPVTETKVREFLPGLNNEAIAEATRKINETPFTLERLRGVSRQIDCVALSDFPPRGQRSSPSTLGRITESIDVYGRRIWLTFTLREDRPAFATRPTSEPSESRRYGETGEV